MTWETPGSFGLPNRTLLDSGAENFRTIKLGLSRENWGNGIMISVLQREKLGTALGE